MAIHGKIVHGPSKFDLMLSLFDIKGNKPRFVTFLCRRDNDPVTREIPVMIISVEREDSSGERWNIKGTDNQGRRVMGYFETNSRDGHLGWPDSI